jgi:predicted MFS family arabinose efflux permease
MQGSLAGLNAVNFFMADVRDGLGPFLGVFLQSNGWSPSAIGLVMTVGGLAGVVATTPAGMLVDRTRAKRAVVVAAAVAIVAGSLTILLSPAFAVTAAAQVVTGVAAALVGPAIAGLTLGLVREQGFARQLGRNEAFNHAGNVIAAVAAGALGYALGIGAVFAVMAAMAASAVFAIAFVDPARIDHAAARGLADEPAAHASGFSVLLTSRPLLVLAGTLALFHLGNAAMLPLLGQAMVARGGVDPAAFTGATIVVAQLTMIPMAILAAWLAERRGYGIVFVLALVALPLRGLIAAEVTGFAGLVPVQVLDGVGAGLLGVAVPGLVARILNGTGHINAGLGAVMSAQGVGAALSSSVAGIVAERFGYGAAFLVLGGIAVLALALWVAAWRAVATAPLRRAAGPPAAPSAARG